MGSCLRAKLGGAAAAQIWGTELLPGSRPPWSLPQGEGTSSLEGTLFQGSGPISNTTAYETVQISQLGCSKDSNKSRTLRAEGCRLLG